MESRCSNCLLSHFTSRTDKQTSEHQDFMRQIPLFKAPQTNAVAWLLSKRRMSDNLCCVVHHYLFVCLLYSILCTVFEFILHFNVT